MLGLKGYGYTKREIKVRKMQMCELQLGIAQEMLVREKAMIQEVRILNITDGSVLNYIGSSSLILAEMNNRFEINLLSAKFVTQKSADGSERTIFVIVIEDAEFEREGTEE